MADQFHKGDTVYSIDGHRGCYIACIGVGHVVEPQYRQADDDEDAERLFGQPTTWQYVFHTPPVAAVDKAIAVKQVELSKLQQQVNAAHLELREIERGARERAARFALHRNLEQLDDFFAGKVTHLVYEEDGRIVGLSEALERTDEWKKKSIRMLALYGDDGRGYGKVECAVRPVWKVCEYGEGSGTRKDVILCTSLEQATQEQLRIIAAGWAVHRAAKEHAWSLAGAIKLAREVGAPIPADILEQHAAMERDSIQKNIPSRRKQLADAQEALRELEERARQAGIPTEPELA
jgi:hypothetical protein